MRKRTVVYAAVCCVAMLTGCGNISQTVKKIELGSTVTVEDLVECKDGVTASIKNVGALNTKKLGSYDVIFNVRDRNGKTEQQTFTYEVVDTTAPEITTEDKITVVKDVSFDIQKLVAATDLSGEVKITFSGSVDTKKLGDYPIIVTAQDNSGNKTTKDIVVTVLKREETNFRNAVWGDNQQMIESLESSPKTYDNGEGYIGFNDTVANLPMLVYYEIDPEYGLYKGIYGVDRTYTTGSDAIADYTTLKEQLIKKYGQPNKTLEPAILSYLAEYSPDAGSALYMGYTLYQAEWTIPEKNTKLFVETSRDEYGILVRILYKDTRYEEDYSDSF